MSDTINKWIGPVQLAIYICILLLSCGIAYATLQNRLGNCEVRLTELKSDHDLIVGMAMKMNGIEQDINEIKADVKELKKSVDRHIITSK